MSAVAPLLLTVAAAPAYAAPRDGHLTETPTAVKTLSQETLNGMQYSAGSIDSILAARTANYYSTAEKPNGYAAQRASRNYNAYGSVETADILDKGALAAVDAGIPFYLNITGGYTDNLHVLPDGHDHSTAFYGAGLRMFQTFGSGRLTGYFGVNLDNYFLDSTQFPRSGSDRYLKDFTLHTGGIYRISDSAALTTRSQYDFTSFGTMGLGVAQPGVLYDDVLRYGSDTQLHYRFDGAKLFEPGIAFTTGLSVTGYDERGGDYGDFYRAVLKQEVLWNQATPQTYYIQGRYGITDYSYLRDYDADFYGAMLGVRGVCPLTGFTVDLAAGVERWTYDYDGLDSRTSLRLEASAEGRLTDNMGLRFTGSYGIQSLLPNAGMDFIDAEGFRGQLRLNYQPCTKWVIGLYGEYQDLSGDIHSGADRDLRNYVLGADIGYRLNDNITITPGVMWIDSSGDGADSDAVIGTLRTTFSF